ncbi:MAG: peptidylprolyl isomerase [Coleofasciculaceae cyanobacterium]
MPETLEKLALPTISPVTDADIVAYLRYSCQIGKIATLAEQDALILSFCEQLGIQVTDEELQAAGDDFRQQHKLLSASETLEWLKQQRVRAEDWSQGIKVSLLRQKLKEHLYGEVVDSHYISNRDDYRRVALSQILVRDLTEAQRLVKMLREEKASFPALALEYSQGKQSRENGGFVGVQFLVKLLPEITQAIDTAKEGEIIDPVHTKFGYHVLRVEKWFPTKLNETAREEILESAFKVWLEQNGNT